MSTISFGSLHFSFSFGIRYFSDFFFFQIMYGVLYAISPEIFPAKDRGTGNGLVFTATRLFGLIVRFGNFFLSCWVMVN